MSRNEFQVDLKVHGTSVPGVAGCGPGEEGLGLAANEFRADLRLVGPLEKQIVGDLLARSGLAEE